jgi:hypothetical protein
MKFNQEGITADQILRSLRAMIKDGGFAAEFLIVDGYSFSSGDAERIAKVKDFAKEMGVSVWYSCTTTGEAPFYDKRNIPLAVKEYAGLFDVIVVLDPKQDHIDLTVSRDRDVYNPEHMALKLDPKTLLILEE